MTSKKYPGGWDEARIRRVLDYYESQSDEEAAAEIDAAFESTTMEVPVALVPVVRELIAKIKSARAPRRNTHNATLPPSRGRTKSKSQRSRGARG